MTPALHFFPIFISMILAVVIGFIWYGPLFGTTWMALAGIQMPTEKPSFKKMLRPIIISLTGALFLAIALSYSIHFANIFLGKIGIGIGLQVAFLNWLGFIVPAELSFVAWEGKPWKLFAIHAGYWLILLFCMSIAISL